MRNEPSAPAALRVSMWTTLRGTARTARQENVSSNKNLILMNKGDAGAQVILTQPLPLTLLLEMLVRHHKPQMRRKLLTKSV